MKKTFYKKWWFWLIAVIVVFLAIGANASKEQESEKTSTVATKEVSKNDTSEKETTFIPEEKPVAKIDANKEATSIPGEKPTATAKTENESTESNTDNKDTKPETTNPQPDTNSNELKDYKSRLNSYIQELDSEYNKRKPSNNINNWGPFGQELKKKVDDFRNEVQNSKINPPDRISLGTAAGNLLLLMNAYGRDLSGRDKSSDINLFKKNINESMADIQ